MGKPNGVFRLFIFICLIVLPLAVQADEWINQRLNQDSTTELQNEEQIAINPANPNNMVAVWRDFRLGYRRLGWSYTFDAGASWTEGGLLEESHYPWHSDPGITTDLDGNFYVIILSYTSTSEPNGFFVQKSTDGGVTWGPSMTVIDQYPGVFEDKEFIACDRTDSAHAGNLYVTWARFSSITEIMYRRSTDSGQTWGNSIRVGDISNVQFPIPVVGRSGEVYIAWTSYYSSAILLDVSTDGGATFGADRTVVNVYTPSTELNGGVDAYSSPHMDADITDGPYSGRLYLSFMDRRSGYTDRDIWVMHSDDLGVNWSPPVRIND
ncbi:MAG: glycoside hydrolase, partial [Candidatus Eisenbacteria bacterium]|nr:glycoside hydrolase [Candidatus Eisenbacteria bacterium]